MDENARKKREWVKTAAIIFLSVMLVLTFFSNTIMNYSLPEVAIQYVQSGTVTAKIRGSGVVESGDPYNIEVTQSRKVASVAVHVGDYVEKGDVILYLADEESEELKTAQEALDQAKRDYEKALLSADITAADIAAANGSTSTASYRQQITSAQKAVEDAQKRVDQLQEQSTALANQILMTPGNNADLGDLQEWYNNAKAEKESAEFAKTAAQNYLDALKSDKTLYEEQIIYYQAIIDSVESADNGDSGEQPGEGSETPDASGEQPGEGSGIHDNSSGTNNSSVNLWIPETFTEQQIAEAKQKVADLTKELERIDNEIEVTAKAGLTAAEQRLASAELAFRQAETALNNQKASGDTTEIKNDLQQQKYAVDAELDNAKEILQDKQEALADLTGMIVNAYGLQDHLDAINKAQEEVDKLTEKSVDAVVTADISGTVTAINVTAGSTTSAATPVAVMQPEGKGYTMSFSVTNEQAKRLAVGDRADLVNAWRYDDVEVVLASIKPDPNDPGQKKLLIFDVSGAVTPGQTFNVSVGQKSANYDYIVPNSSIREDNNGKFILVVTAKPGPLSTRYIATRVDVEVLASDDSQSAVSSGMLNSYDSVITTATKPVEAGMQVRLSDN